MSVKLQLPKRIDPIVEEDRSATRRFFEFLNSIPSIGDAQADVSITWTAHEPTSSTAMTIADGSSITVVETAQAIANLNAQINNLLDELRTAGVIKSS